MLQHVNPFIGVDGSGECLPGPYLPLGLVRLSPDTVAPQKTNGYCSADPIKHFSHTHVAGTGGMSRYGNIGVLPFTGVARLHVDPFGRVNEHAACNYYAVTTANAGVQCELTATARVGVHRYRFPDNVRAHVLLDVGAAVQPPFPGYQMDPNGWPPISVGGFVEFVSDRALVGRGDYRGGWGHNEPYSIYFYAEFDQPFAEGRIGQAGSWLPVPGGGSGANLAAVASFGAAREVNLRVGVSYVSVAKARASVTREVVGAGTIERRVGGLPVLKPSWALADMLQEQGWGNCGLQPDDIEWSEITEQDDQEWETACAVFDLPRTKLQDKAQDARGHCGR